ncbi:hypothetical protein G6O69_38605 [Pseudenhygromyxa sp. WMMC2535]|uniref:hypothetical protein n=1 Tax=Pseudenhygromyxa sp. WMMC2535 TaxID=2712867 RepID=UPI001595D4C0|nr:hypothetical protein [Pseudenhygromyxa sp. WMMC2535]NVB43773.1 hypothetical protein [Pseudenhygromyxa sp. WMMC2535]
MSLALCEERELLELLAVVSLTDEVSPSISQRSCAPDSLVHVPHSMSTSGRTDAFGLPQAARVSVTCR